MIKNLQWNNRENNIEWNVGDKKVKIETSRPPFSVITTLKGENLAIVFSNDEYGKDNAYIYNSNGEIKCKLLAPKNIRDVICFHEIYYIVEKLTAIIATSQCDFACEINEETCEIERVYETR